jgi:hypothetical protein
MSKLWIENIPGQKNVQYTSADLSSTHTDESSSIEAWDNHGLKVLQYMHVRRHISVLVATKSAMFSLWGDLTPEEQEIAARYVVAPYALRKTVYSDDEDRENYQYLIQKLRGVPKQSLEGRSYIVETMRERVADKKRVEQWGDDQLDAFFDHTNDYITGYEFANKRKLIHWICNEPGTPFENDGFAEATYVDSSDGQTKSLFDQAVKDDLVAIYYDYH